jgi:hypothetical protein
MYVSCVQPKGTIKKQYNATNTHLKANNKEKTVTADILFK